MIDTPTVGDPELESEYLASCIVSGILYPADYNTLRINIAGLEFLDASNDLTDMLDVIQKETTSKFGILKDTVVEKYYYGEEPDLFKVFEVMHEHLQNLELMYGVATQEKFMQIADDIAEKSQSMKYEDVGQAVDETALESQHMHDLDKTHLQLRKMIGITSAILKGYGAAKGKLLKRTKVKPKTLPDYEMFLQELTDNLDVVCNNMQLSSVVGRVLDSINSLWPQNELDPYLMDVSNNFIAVITEPKDFYSMCKQDEIISPSVGQMFGHCYPEYYSKFVDMYTDNINEIDYQSQLDFRKCFGMVPDDSQLTALCSQYIKLGFKQQ